jgi:hypothetical protein
VHGASVRVEKAIARVNLLVALAARGLPAEVFRAGVRSARGASARVSGRGAGGPGRQVHVKVVLADEPAGHQRRGAGFGLIGRARECDELSDALDDSTQSDS